MLENTHKLENSMARYTVGFSHGKAAKPGDPKSLLPRAPWGVVHRRRLFTSATFSPQSPLRTSPAGMREVADSLGKIQYSHG